MGRSKLIALEGPAGVGKSTIAENIVRYLRSNSVHVVLVPEFCEGVIGEAICAASKFGCLSPPPWLSGLSGRLAYLSSRVHALECAILEEAEWIIADRFFLTELVYLRLSSFDEVKDRVMREAIVSMAGWFYDQLDPSSRLVLLERESRHQSLLDRCPAPWTHDLELHVRSEGEAFAAMRHCLPWEAINIRVNCSPNELAKHIFRRVESGI